MTWTAISPTDVQMRTGLYSLAASAKGRMIFTAGIVSIDAAGQTIGLGNAEVQTTRVIETIRSILAEAGVKLEDVVHVQIFLRDLVDYAAVNEVYKRYFVPPYPARYCVQAALVSPEWLVEIAVTAVVAEDL
ncbi:MULTISPECIES: RidA family protein [Paraburkholderia]|jgi:reactive intermediate/imine deaminase|uniref:RidA family protein n=1 Tax=Paraburkholderia TaxID=1822464 RepID=UPI0038B776B0